MDGDPHLQNSPPETVTWNDLPLVVQTSILIRLPVSDVASCASVSRQFLTLVRSPAFIKKYSTSPRHREDIALVVVLFTAQNVALAYHPSRSRWTSFPFPSTVRPFYAFGRTLLYGHHVNELVAVNVFSQDQDSIPPMPPSYSPSFMLPMIEEEEDSTAYMIVAITFIPIIAVVYDSNNRQWTEKNETSGCYTTISNPVFLNGHVLVLSGYPLCLLTFNPVTGESSVRDVHRPPFWGRCYLLVYDKRLFAIGVAIGGVETLRIHIWELDHNGGSYSLHDSMPENLLTAWLGMQAEGATLVLETRDWKGMVFFFSRSPTLSFVMYDIPTRQWSQVLECDHPAAVNIINPQMGLDVLALELHPQLLHRYNNCLQGEDT